MVERIGLLQLRLYRAAVTFRHKRHSHLDSTHTSSVPAASLFEGASSCSHKRQRLRKATSTTTRRSASELRMHSVKRRESAQRKNFAAKKVGARAPVRRSLF